MDMWRAKRVHREVGGSFELRNSSITPHFASTSTSSFLETRGLWTHHIQKRRRRPSRSDPARSANPRGAALRGAPPFHCRRRRRAVRAPARSARARSAHPRGAANVRRAAPNGAPKAPCCAQRQGAEGAPRAAPASGGFLYRRFKWRNDILKFSSKYRIQRAECRVHSSA